MRDDLGVNVVGGRFGPVGLAVLGGCLLLVEAASSPPQAPQGPFLDLPFDSGLGGTGNWEDWLFLLVTPVATVVGLCLLRWWPYLLAVAALMAVPTALSEWNFGNSYPWIFVLLPIAGYPLAIIGMLACAQGLSGRGAGWGASVLALVLGSRLAGYALMGGISWTPLHTRAAWDGGLLAAGLVALGPALWFYRRGDPAASGLASGRRLVAGVLAAAVPVGLVFLTPQRVADLLGIGEYSLYRNLFAQGAVIGAVTLVIVTLLAALAGRWSLAAVVTATLAQVAITAPVLLAIDGLQANDPQRWLAVLAAAGLGAAVAGSRWRVPLAATLAVLAAITLFIACGATNGQPEKLADQRLLIPSMLILVLCAAAGGAVTGATAPVLAARGALPVALGPLVGTLVVGGLKTFAVTYRSGTGLQTEAAPLTASAIVFLVVAVAIGGLGFAQLLATRNAERKQAEQIRREAAAAERDRLGRSIHDGVLQVLALVQHEGVKLGAEGSELAALAGEQEVALRGLLASEPAIAGGAAEDLRGRLQALATPAVEVATPAQAVLLPSGVTAEVVAAVGAALDNVGRHAGAGARAWILLEDEQDGVRVSVRDDGVGFPPERPAEAAQAGRLGIAQSMRGRIADCGGTTTIDSRPGEGTEVEFWIPRKT